MNKTATEKNSDYKVRRIKKLSTDYLDKVTIDWLAGRKDEAKLHITEFINDTRLLGLTGADAKEVYTGLVENIAAVGEYYIATGDVSDLDEIDEMQKSYSVMGLCEKYVDSSNFDKKLKKQIKEKLAQLYNNCVNNYDINED